MVKLKIKKIKSIIHLRRHRIADYRYLKITSSSFESRDIQNNATNIRALEFSWDAEDNNELIVGFDFYYKK